MPNELSIVYQGTANLYAVIRDRADLTQVWNGTVFETWSDVNVATYDVALAAQGGDVYAADFPGDIDPGNYRVLYYKRAGGTPATSDLLLTTDELYWNGTSATEPVDGYVGRYTTEAAVEQYLGTLNLNAYADVDSDGTRDAGATEQAIVSAEARVDYYRSGPYDVDDGTSIGAQLLETWSRKLASVEVARKRLGKTNDDLDALETAVIAEMKEGMALPGVTEDETDTSALEKLQALTPARGKLNCPMVCPPCWDTTCN